VELQTRPLEAHILGNRDRDVPADANRQAPPRIRIEHPAPTVDGGRWPVKRTSGDTVGVSADIFRDGHEVLRAAVRWRGPGERRWHEAPMQPVDAHLDGVRWAGELTVGDPGRWTWSILAWTDPFASWRDEVARKLAAGQADLSGELSEGLVLLRAAAGRAKGADARSIAAVADELQAGASLEAALDPGLAELIDRYPDRGESAELDQRLEVDVDRVRARFGSWYELFPRSWGGFAGVERVLPELAELGFDVLYLPPIHPIGRKNRKGRNNALVAGPGDPGSPWAIGSPEGGHTAIHPDLGTMDEFERLVAAGREQGVEIALDFAIQCSADHPWLTEHPEWFHHHPDGTLKYAENPPKKYQDIYNVNWACEDWRGLWDALLEVVRFWVARGVKAFRVDNPHTKPLPFWEWLIAEIRATDPDVIFLAEAFTRRAMMRALARVGFSQSYTYFTWKGHRWELTEYVSELATSGEQEYFRPNFFVNTPDILTEELQHGGPAKFASRLVLAATLSPSYGIYSGFERFEHEPVRPGSEEYLDSEKYQLRERRLDGPLLGLVRRLNELRRENPALQRLDNVRFLDTENDALIAYAKRDGDNAVITVVSLDPVNAQEGVAVVPYELGTPPAFAVTDLLSGERFDWRLGRNYVRLDPGERAAHILRVETS
jgi:starch synthase (maltosyl-transferring)